MNHDPHDPSRPSAAPAGDPDAALVIALARSRVMQDAPESVIQRAISTFAARPRPAAAPAPVSPLRRLVAVLGFDSAALAPQAAGLRSAGASSRQMLFSAEGRDVDLRIAAGAGGWQLSGQVLGPDDIGEVELQCGAFRTAQPWNDLAEFHLPGVPAGRWQIVLRSAEWTMELPELQVPSEGG